MPTLKELEFDLKTINWEKTGEHIETTPEGVLIRDNRGSDEVIAIKGIERGQNSEELNDEIRDIVRDRCFKIHCEDLTYYSEVYERENLVGPYLPPNIHRNNQLIARAYYGQPLIAMIRGFEEVAREIYPMGYSVYKKLVREDENAIRALRKYTKKVLGSKVGYRTTVSGGVELYHFYFKDLPEEVFKNEIAKISKGGWIELRDIQHLPYMVKKALSEEKKKQKRIVEANTIESEELHSRGESYNPFDGYELIQECGYVEEVMSEKLTKREIDALILIHKKDLGLTGAANRLGITKQALAETEKRAINKLRNCLSK